MPAGFRVYMYARVSHVHAYRAGCFLDDGEDKEGGEGGIHPPNPGHATGTLRLLQSACCV